MITKQGSSSCTSSSTTSRFMLSCWQDYHGTQLIGLCVKSSILLGAIVIVLVSRSFIDVAVPQLDLDHHSAEFLSSFGPACFSTSRLEPHTADSSRSSSTIIGDFSHVRHHPQYHLFSWTSRVYCNDSNDASAKLHELPRTPGGGTALAYVDRAAPSSTATAPATASRDVDPSADIIIPLSSSGRMAAALGRVIEVPQWELPWLPPADLARGRFVILGHGPIAERHMDTTGDFCKGISHQRSSLTCSLAIAKFLNRTLLLDMMLCVSAKHNRNRTLLGQPLPAYFDLPLADRQGHRLVSLRPFLEAMEAWNKGHPELPITRRQVAKEGRISDMLDDNWTNVLELEMELKATGFGLCNSERNADVVPILNDTALEFQPLLVGLAREIAKKLGKRFYAVHVRRGDKLLDKKKWPNLDNDTRPESLLEKLPALVSPRSKLYIATNEQTPHFFDPLRKLYDIYMLQDFGFLWAEGSKWHEEMEERFGRPMSFDGYMQGIVDYSVQEFAIKSVHTFNDLTSDARNGNIQRRRQARLQRHKELAQMATKKHKFRGPEHWRRHHTIQEG